MHNLPAFTAGDASVLREILNPAKAEELVGVQYSLAHATVQSGSATLKHSLTSSEVYYILSGRGVMHVDVGQAEVGPGDAIYIPPGSVQFIENTGEKDLEFLCIVDPAWVPECETVLEEE